MNSKSEKMDESNKLKELLADMEVTNYKWFVNFKYFADMAKKVSMLVKLYSNNTPVLIEILTLLKETAKAETTRDLVQATILKLMSGVKDIVAQTNKRKDYSFYDEDYKDIQIKNDYTPSVKSAIEKLNKSKQYKYLLGQLLRKYNPEIVSLSERFEMQLHNHQLRLRESELQLVFSSFNINYMEVGGIKVDYYDIKSCYLSILQQGVPVGVVDDNYTGETCTLYTASGYATFDKATFVGRHHNIYKEVKLAIRKIDTVTSILEELNSISTKELKDIYTKGIGNLAPVKRKSGLRIIAHYVWFKASELLRRLHQVRTIAPSYSFKNNFIFSNIDSICIVHSEDNDNLLDSIGFNVKFKGELDIKPGDLVKKSECSNFIIHGQGVYMIEGYVYRLQGYKLYRTGYLEYEDGVSIKIDIANIKTFMRGGKVKCVDPNNPEGFIYKEFGFSVNHKKVDNNK